MAGAPSMSRPARPHKPLSALITLATLRYAAFFLPFGRSVVSTAKRVL